MSITRQITKTIRHDELHNGMRDWREGVCFEVTDLSKFKETPECSEVTVRFIGVIVPGKSEFGDELLNTAYNHGTYGAYGSIPACVEFDSIPVHLLSNDELEAALTE